MNTSSQVVYMAVPRLCALAEVLWTKPELKDFEDFKKRLARNMLLLDLMKVNYSKAMLNG
jgi:hexosaminidase